MIAMDSTTQLKIDIITKVAEGKISTCNAVKLLNKSKRTVEIYINQYHKVGIPFSIHKNLGKSSANKINSATKHKV
jgi:hypothetical protein